MLCLSRELKRSYIRTALLGYLSPRESHQISLRLRFLDPLPRQVAYFAFSILRIVAAKVDSRSFPTFTGASNSVPSFAVARSAASRQVIALSSLATRLTRRQTIAALH